jgi:hypothetical protein
VLLRVSGCCSVFLLAARRHWVGWIGLVRRGWMDRRMGTWQGGGLWIWCIVIPHD